MNTNETPVWKGTPSHWTNAGTYLVCLIIIAAVIAAYFLTTAGPLVLVALAVPGFIMFWRWLNTRCHVYEITSERIRLTTGILSRKSQELELYRVRDYTTVQPFWLRLVGRGHLVLQTSDRSTPEFHIRAVPDVNGLRDKIRANTEELRQRRGVRDIEVDTQ